MAVGKQSLVEIRDEALAGGIRDRSHTKQGDTVRGGELGHPAGFHFHGGSPASPPVECGIPLCGRRASNRRPAASTAVATKTSPIPSAGSSAPQNPILTIASGWHAGQATSTARPACAAPAPFATIHSCRPPDSPDLAQ